ncbi:MAG: PqqD family protein [Clostridiales bacterium]|nr:PqqD family protein [Clostridiales bacterium]
MNKQYFIDDERIISEEIDKDTVVINLETGCYYSFNETASYIFFTFNNGDIQEQVIKGYQLVFSVDKNTATSDITKILSYLLDKQLLTEGISSQTSDTNHIPQPYIAPLIEEFDDMREMLLLDPIHEVKEEGWPHKKDE